MLTVKVPQPKKVRRPLMVPKPPTPPKVPIPSEQDGGFLSNSVINDYNNPSMSLKLTPADYNIPSLIPPTAEVPQKVSLLPVSNLGQNVQDPNTLRTNFAMTDTSGNPSGRDLTKLGSGNEEKKTQRPLPNVRPLVDVANYLANLNSINKVRGVQLARKNMYQATPSLSVRPIQDLTPEILAEEQNARTQIRSDYHGSDPAMKAIYDNMATAERDKVRGQQIAGRSANLVAERGRFDTENRTNQQMAAETAATNLNRAQDFADYKTGVNTAALEAKKKLNSDFLSQVGMNLDTAAQYNLTREGVSEQNRRQHYEDMTKWAFAAPTDGEKQRRLAALDTEFPNGYTAHLIPKFRDAQAGGLDSTFLGRLFTRGDYNKIPSDTGS